MARAVKGAAVIGTGTMGPGMGAVLARAGIETALYDVSDEQLEKAKACADLAGQVLERLEAAHEDGGFLRFERCYEQSARLGRSLIIHTSSKSPRHEMAYRKNFAPPETGTVMVRVLTLTVAVPSSV